MCAWDKQIKIKEELNYTESNVKTNIKLFIDAVDDKGLAINTFLVVFDEYYFSSDKTDNIKTALAITNKRVPVETEKGIINCFELKTAGQDLLRELRGEEKLVINTFLIPERRVKELLENVVELVNILKRVEDEKTKKHIVSEIEDVITTAFFDAVDFDLKHTGPPP